MLHSRIKRVQENYLHELTKIINYDLQDPRLKMVSVTRVKISKDLREAVVHVSLLEDDPQAAEAVIDALDESRGFIKRILATRISLKRLPNPKFFLDTTTKDAFLIMSKMREFDHNAETPGKEE